MFITTKIERLMQMILELNKKEKVTAKELANKFEVDIRTIYRDINALSEMNVPIVSNVGYEGGYSLLGDYFIPPVMFNEDEIFALMLSRKVIEKTGIPGYGSSIATAFSKLESVMNDKLTESYQEMSPKIIIEERRRLIKPKEMLYFSVIKEGLDKKLKVKIKRLDPNTLETKETIISPYGLIYDDEVWKAVGYDEQYCKLDSIAINIIKGAELTDELFCIQEGFDLYNYYCKNHCRVQCKKMAKELVKIKVKKSHYYSLKDYIYFFNGEVVDDGTDYIMTIKAKNPEFYGQLAFRFIDSIEILEPQWLREQFIQKLERVYRNYKNNTY